ncbi:uncharacterized protein [Dendrobates tinctorius]|uniref:uncharacterized protein n=1 Tax=Dendrobates tinctorius TaxID=92724 RepID=UPI003CC96C3A
MFVRRARVAVVLLQGPEQKHNRHLEQQPVPGAVLHRTTSDPSQPSDSQEASCRSAPQTAGDKESGQSSVRLSQVSATGFASTFRQRQRASDRNVMPEFLHLSSVFQNGLKVLSDRVESGFTLMEHRFQAFDNRLGRLEADLNRPAHHFFHQIERAMAEHLSPDLQLTVMQACNTAFLQAMQQSQYVQQSVVSFPIVPPLTRFTSLPTSAAYHCTATCIPSQAGHHYTTPRPNAAGHSTATTMASAAPVWTTTATTTPAWTTTAATTPARSTATTPPAGSTATVPPAWSTTTANAPPAWSTATATPAWSTATATHVWSTITAIATHAWSTATVAWTSTATTEQQQRGDPHSIFVESQARFTSSRQ